MKASSTRSHSYLFLSTHILLTHNLLYFLHSQSPGWHSSISPVHLLSNKSAVLVHTYHSCVFFISCLSLLHRAYIVFFKCINATLLIIDQYKNGILTHVHIFSRPWKRDQWQILSSNYSKSRIFAYIYIIYCY